MPASVQAERKAPQDQVLTVLLSPTNYTESTPIPSALVGQRQDNQMWGLPGGGIDQGEGPAIAAAREYVEEHGVRDRILESHGKVCGPKIVESTIRERADILDLECIMPMSNGATLYVCRGWLDERLEDLTSSDEVVDAKLVSVDDVFEMLYGGDLKDGWPSLTWLSAWSIVQVCNRMVNTVDYVDPTMHYDGIPSEIHCRFTDRVLKRPRYKTDK